VTSIGDSFMQRMKERESTFVPLQSLMSTSDSSYALRLQEREKQTKAKNEKEERKARKKAKAERKAKEERDAKKERKKKKKADKAKQQEQLDPHLSFHFRLQKSDQALQSRLKQWVEKK
jgi:hypothetical protein